MALPIVWPLLSCLVHLSLYTNCPLTSLTRTNHWTKYGVPQPQREKNEKVLGAPHYVMERKKERAEIGSCLANEVKTESLLERLCDKGQSKHLQSVAGVGEKKGKVDFLHRNKCNKALLQQFRGIKMSLTSFPFLSHSLVQSIMEELLI